MKYPPEIINTRALISECLERQQQDKLRLAQIMGVLPRNGDLTFGLLKSADSIESGDYLLELLKKKHPSEQDAVDDMNAIREVLSIDTWKLAEEMSGVYEQALVVQIETLRLTFVRFISYAAASQNEAHEKNFVEQAFKGYELCKKVIKLLNKIEAFHGSRQTTANSPGQTAKGGQGQVRGVDADSV